MAVDFVPDTVLFDPNAEADAPVTVFPGQVAHVCAFIAWGLR